MTELEYWTLQIKKGRISRREFMGRAAALGVTTVLATTILSQAGVAAEPIREEDALQATLAKDDDAAVRGDRQRRLPVVEPAVILVEDGADIVDMAWRRGTGRQRQQHGNRDNFTKTRPTHWKSFRPKT